MPTGGRPEPDLPSFARHEATVVATADRDLKAAELAMRADLVGVARNLLEIGEAAA